MEQRLSIVTLGVQDLARSRAFYDRLGWEVASEDGADGIVCYDLNGIGLALYPWEALADDAQVPAEGQGFRGIALACNVRSRQEVALVLAAAVDAGGTISKEAQDTSWGGLSGYFADPDGQLWEVAWNPHSPLGAKGEFRWGGASAPSAGARAGDSKLLSSGVQQVILLAVQPGGGLEDEPGRETPSAQ